MSIMDKLLKAVFQIQEFKFRTDDDFVDRLNRQYTPTIMVLFTILVSVKQYVGEPIDCWCPAQFTGSHIDYTNTVCWVSNTYYVPFERTMPLVDEPREMISYYQWVPLILLSQAWLFFMPCVVWRFLNHRIGLSLSAVIEAAQSVKKSIYTETREKTIRYMVMQIDSYLMQSRSFKKGCCVRIKQILADYCCVVCGKFYGNYLTCTYLITKILYCTNAILQLFMLDYFLGFRTQYHLYGIHSVARMIRGEDWYSSERFPRVTLCDFQIRQQTNVHRYTVQCVLPINLFNEKIFLFIWFWLFTVAITTLFNFFHWIGKIIIVPMQVPFIKRELRAMNLDKREMKTARKFTENYLRRDGLFILRMVSKNAGDLIAAELLHGLWQNYGPDRRGIPESEGRRERPLMSQEIGSSSTMNLTQETTFSQPKEKKTLASIAMTISLEGERWRHAKRLITGKKGEPEIHDEDGRIIRPEEI